MRSFLLAISLVAALCAPAIAANGNSNYYASIKADEANVRTGPSVKYPIRWVYKRENWPVEVTASFEGWRKIRDINGEVGWVHEGLLSGRRFALVTSKAEEQVYRLPVNNAAPVFLVENETIVELVSCKEDWCQIAAQGYEGWLRKKYLWGINDDEEIIR